jgi:hypothetical protein
LAYVRNQGQTAVDAAALAGAAGIPNYNKTGDSSLVDNLIKASDNSVMNGAAGLKIDDAQFCGGSSSNPTCPWSNSKTAAGVKVSKTFQAPVFFGRLLDGKSTANITVSSIAWVGGVAGIAPDLPIVLCASPPPTGVGFNPDPPDGPTCVEGASIKFRNNGSDNGGYWGSLSSGANANQCKDWTEHPDHIPYTRIGDDIKLQNGEDSSCHKKIDTRFAACDANICANGTDEQKKACTVIVPIINCPGSINQTEAVVGFAAWCITKSQATPASNATLDGTLRCDVEPPSPADPGGPPFSVYPTKAALVR